MSLLHKLVVLLVAALPLFSGLDDTHDGECLLQTKSHTHQGASVLDRLWQGEDLTEDEHNKALPLLSFREDLRILPGRIKDIRPNLLVRHLGMFGAGTHLMAAYLQHTFGIASERHDYRDTSLEAKGVCESSFGEKLQRVQPRCKMFWKHTHPLRIKSFDPNATTVLVAMVRNPISQIASWDRMSFNLWQCMETWGKCNCMDVCDDVNGHCGSETPNYFPCGQVARNMSRNSSSYMNYIMEQSMPYMNRMDVWNAYGDGYQRLADIGATVKLVIVQYEELVLDPTAVLKRVAEAIGVDLPEKSEPIMGNQRKFDHEAGGRDEAIDILKSKSYRRKFSDSERSTMCSAFKPSLLVELGYEEECAGSD